ncbi:MULTISPECIES: RluA family pseudouridine synthase [unclassified Carboxylicivirga]|uniref:RluA family pseudouridine synthase n=1 Tax=Carboxylicivirga TaxID=1628153 RepID=UPI003D33A364
MKKLDILYEDNHIIAVNKSASDIVQGDKTGDETLSDRVKAYIKKKYNKPGEVFLGVVHRLDRPVSGVVLFARTSKALSRLNKMFQEKTVKKTYWALVAELPESDSGRLVHHILKNSEKNKSYAFPKPRSGSKEAILNYRLVSGLKNYYLLEVDLETGRHHQIRCQLAKIGCPIRGDLKYGFPRSNKDGSISLHARKIEFVHPVKQEPICIVAPTPPTENLWKEFRNVQEQ